MKSRGELREIRNIIIDSTDILEQRDWSLELLHDLEATADVLELLHKQIREGGWPSAESILPVLEMMMFPRRPEEELRDANQPRTRESPDGGIYVIPKIGPMIFPEMDTKGTST